MMSLDMHTMNDIRVCVCVCVYTAESAAVKDCWWWRDGKRMTLNDPSKKSPLVSSLVPRAKHLPASPLAGLGIVPTPCEASHSEQNYAEGRGKKNHEEH